MKKLFLLVILVTTAGGLLAQNGTIGGKVTDHKTNETIVGANVVIQGTTVGSSTDIDGNFQITNLKPGVYTIEISFVTFKTQVIPDVVVESGKITTLGVSLVEDVAELAEVIVQAKREINTDYSLINEIKLAKLVVSGISSEQIVKLPDGDAAQVMKRVPGLTIVDNRFVMVRGVPERYNQVMINSAIAPSTEIDKRSFSFDLIPSGAIDQLLIYKTGASELPGDFAGGVIQVLTKATSEDDYFSFGLNFGLRTNTTFKDSYRTQSSSTDFLGFDNGTRALPSNFPSIDALKNTSQLNDLREDAGKSLSNNFDLIRTTAPVDHGLNFGFAKTIKLGAVKFSNLTNVSYSRSFMSFNSNYTRYGTFDTDPSTTSEEIYDFQDKIYSNEAKLNIVHNWLANFGNSNTIEFKNVFAQVGEDKTTLRSGTDITSLPGLYNNNAYHYVSRSIYSGQLQGNFKTPNGLNSFKAVLGLNYVHRDEPDFRRFRRIFDETEQKFRMILPPSANLFDAGRFYSDLKDIGYSSGLTYERKLKNSDEKRVPTLKAGYFVEYRTRDFNARYVSYLFPGSFDQGVGYNMSFQPLNTIFSEQSLFSNNGDGSFTEGFSVQEGTSATDSYRGTNLLTAAYTSVTLPVGKFDLAGGLRYERNEQKLITLNGDSTNTKLISIPLPFANIAYNISDRALFRLGYSRTINRPEFREIAPFLFYQFEYNLNIQGNPDLKIATINNFDLRWEMYPNPGETISIGTFYKSFKDPIEFAQINASGNLQFGYQNAPEAYVYGAEFEFRKSFASFGVSKFLRNTSFNINASMMKSQVDMGKGTTFQERFRPLQGQSPYVINAGAYYMDPDLGLSVNVGYNIFGNRIFSVGSVLFPTWVERPRNSVDLQIAKSFNKMEIKFNASNLLNAQYRFYQDNDENTKIDESIDDAIMDYRVGTQYSLSWSWKFIKG